MTEENSEWGIDEALSAKKKRKKKKQPSGDIINANLRDAHKRWLQNGGRVLTPEERQLKQTALVQLLLAGKNYKECAEELDLNPRLVQKWTCKPQFREQLDRARRQVLNVGLTRLAAMSMKAIGILSDGMDSADPKEQMNAAKAFFDVLAKWQTMYGVDARLNEIEDALGIMGGPNQEIRSFQGFPVEQAEENVEVRVPRKLPDVDLTIPGG